MADGVTVSVKLSLALAAPSLTVTVMTADPLWPAAGVTLTVRLAPEPPKTILPTGTRVGFEEAAVNVRLPGGVSASFIENGIAAVATPEVVD